MRKVSKLLWSPKADLECALMREECARVASIGGTFTIETVYSYEWYIIYTIDYPDS